MSTTLKVRAGKGGWGKELLINFPAGKKIMYMVGGTRPALVDRLVELTGLEAVDGFKESCGYDEMAVAVIDCGGSMRCGLYPKNNVPTLNVMPTGKSGVMAKHINESNYVSNVDASCISMAGAHESAPGAAAAPSAGGSPRFLPMASMIMSMSRSGRGIT